MNAELEALLKAWHIAYDFNLKPDDKVVVAGCYTGKVMELLLNMYPGIYIDGYDMQHWALEQAITRLLIYGNEYWRVHSYGLGVLTKSVKLWEYNTDACSVFREGSRDSANGSLVEYTTALQTAGVTVPDLLVLNMEGYEFPLLKHILENVPELPRKLAVQWHLNIGAGDEDDMYDLITDLQFNGYKLIYNHTPQWSYMELRSGQ